MGRLGVNLEKGGDGGAFRMLPYQETRPDPSAKGCPQLQAALTLSFLLQTWTNVSRAHESAKATASAATSWAATPATARPALRSNRRTQSSAQVEAPGRRRGRSPGGSCSRGGGTRCAGPHKVTDPLRPCLRSRLPGRSGHRAGRQQGPLGLEFPCGAPRPHPFLVPHVQAEEGVTSGSEKRNHDHGQGGSGQESLVRKSSPHDSVSLLVLPKNSGPWFLLCPSYREATIRCFECEVEGHQVAAGATMALGLGQCKDRGGEA